MDSDNADRLRHLIETRHSSRVPFDPAWRVNEHELTRIVDAARWAPTAHNMQNFRLVVVNNLARASQRCTEVTPAEVAATLAAVGAPSVTGAAP